MSYLKRGKEFLNRDLQIVSILDKIVFDAKKGPSYFCDIKLIYP